MERGVTEWSLIKVATGDFLDGRSFLLFFARREIEVSFVFSSSIAADVRDVKMC
jgi:hypothetical protein